MQFQVLRQLPCVSTQAVCQNAPGVLKAVSQTQRWMGPPGGSLTFFGLATECEEGSKELWNLKSVHVAPLKIINIWRGGWSLQYHLRYHNSMLPGLAICGLGRLLCCVSWNDDFKASRLEASIMPWDWQGQPCQWMGRLWSGHCQP